LIAAVGSEVGGELDGDEPSRKILRTQRVRDESEMVAVTILARRVAEQLGFDRRRAVAVAIVAAELASNMVKHAHGGEMILAVRHGANGEDFLLIARDRGRPIRDLQAALADGCDDLGPIDPAVLSRRGGLGTGLGAVVRLTDGFEVTQHRDHKDLTARFSLAPAPTQKRL
jgi:anti-sigma regulatory factor (Ser/Thr protein kinase)